jgi:ubiquinone/menaquinone biosynthesis C-methylase UbiE
VLALALLSAALLGGMLRETPRGWLGVTLGDDHAAGGSAARIERVLALLGIGPGSTVADVGAGSGYFTERLAALVGPTGRVIAVDIDPDALRQLASRFRSSSAVAVQRGGASDPGCPPASLDAVLMVDAFHEVQAPEAMLAALRRDLRPDGRLVVVDRPAKEWAAGSHTIPEERVVAQAQAAGFHLRERTDLPRQFAVVLD